MYRLLSLFSWGGLAATLVPSLLFLAGTITRESVHIAMAVGMVVWFGSRLVRGAGAASPGR